MENRFMVWCFEENKQLAAGLHFPKVPRVGDYIQLPDQSNPLKVEYLEWQVKRPGELVTTVHVYGRVIPPMYR